MTFARKLFPLHSLLFAGLVATTPAAMAHGDAEHTPAGPVKKEQKPWGIAGDAQAAKRTIEIRMTDNMRFTPDDIEIRQGETIRFRHMNNGNAMHEFVLGTKAELDEHAALMKKFPNMEHDEPYMAHVPAGKQGEIVWTFNRPGEFDFACLLPGHYEAGMVGKIRVVAAAATKKEKG
jgi:uncharacterized cupredoxin-like copper-binding protein